MRRLLYIFSILLFIFSCASNKNIHKSCEKYPFEELDSLQRANQFLNYSIDKHKAWKKGKASNGDSYYLNDRFIDSLKYYSQKASLYVSLNKIRNRCSNQEYTIENYLDYFINNRSRRFKEQDFKYLLLKSKHKIYGDIYIVKYTEKINYSKTFTRSFFLFFYNKLGYTIQYVAEPKFYDTYLPEVEKMINSFRIKE